MNGEKNTMRVEEVGVHASKKKKHERHNKRKYTKTDLQFRKVFLLLLLEIIMLPISHKVQLILSLLVDGKRGRDDESDFYTMGYAKRR